MFAARCLACQSPVSTEAARCRRRVQDAADFPSTAKATGGNLVRSGAWISDAQRKAYHGPTPAESLPVRASIIVVRFGIWHGRSMSRFSNALGGRRGEVEVRSRLPSASNGKLPARSFPDIRHAAAITRQSPSQAEQQVGRYLTRRLCPLENVFPSRSSTSATPSPIS